jgi:hypothetical protein
MRPTGLSTQATRSTSTMDSTTSSLEDRTLLSLASDVPRSSTGTKPSTSLSPSLNPQSDPFLLRYPYVLAGARVTYSA